MWHTVEISREDQNTISVTVDEGNTQRRRLSANSAAQFDHSNIMYIGGEYHTCSAILINSKPTHISTKLYTNLVV